MKQSLRLITLSALVLCIPGALFANAPRFCGTFDVFTNPISVTTNALKKSVSSTGSIARIVRITAHIDTKTFSEAALQAYGWKLLIRVGDVVTLSGPASGVSYLSAVPGILSTQFNTTIRYNTQCMDTARKFSNVNQVHNFRTTASPILHKSYTGKKVLVGIIDTDFDTHHPAFLDSLKKTRFIAIWNQVDSTNAAHSGYGYGTIKKGNALNTDSGFGLASENHGTLMASYAAGSDTSLPFYGVAPGAMLIGVKYDYNNSQYIEADIVNGLSWIFHIADSLHVPCVVNMSIGISYGPHDGTDLVDRAIDSLSTAGHIVVGAAGNDGDKASHIAFALSGNTAKNTWVLPIVDSLFNPPRAQAISGADIWGDSGKTISGQYYILDLRNNTYKTSSHTVNTSVTRNYATDVVIWTDTTLHTTDTLSFYTSVEKANSLNNKPHIEMYLVTTNPKLQLGLSLSYLNNVSGTVHAWNIEKKPFTSYGISGYTNGDSNSTVNAIGGTSKSIICVGAYISKGKIKLWNGGYFDKLVPDSMIGAICSFSSLGPTIDNRIKPDITAPGDMVVGAMSRTAPEKGQTAYWPDTTNKYNRYTRGTGTSVSAPIVAGVIALMLEADPTLTVTQVKQLIQSSAIHDAHTGVIVTPNTLWGAGKIDALGALGKQLGLSAINPQTSFVRVYNAGVSLRMVMNGHRLMLQRSAGAAGVLDIMLYSCSGRMLMHFQTSGNSINVPRSIAQGTYIVCAQRAGTVVARQRVAVW